MNKLTDHREEKIINQIYFIRGYNVMLDFDLALLYGVETRILNQAVKRQLNRFPSDFIFQLTKEEFSILKSQIVISSWGGRRKIPYAFTEHGTIMLANVLRSKSAIQASISVVRAFLQLRTLLETNKDLARKIEELESRYDQQFQVVFEAIKQLISKESKPRKEVGYLAK